MEKENIFKSYKQIIKSCKILVLFWRIFTVNNEHVRICGVEWLTGRLSLFKMADEAQD